MTDPELARRWGIDPGYHDVTGRWREAPPDTVAAVADCMGVSGAGPYEDPAATVTVRLDHPLPDLGPGVVHLEHGGEVVVAGGALPGELPVGYHRFVPARDRPEHPLVVSPGRVPLPEGRRWGWAAQLYAARSRRSWGMGDLADLRRLGEWSAGLGAGLVLVNPLHAPAPGPVPEASPYYASSRCFANPLYLHVEALPGAEGLEGIERAAAAGRALNAERRVDRRRVWALKSQALEALYAGFAGDADFDRYRAERGPALEGFATFGALAERHGLPWQGWPAPYRHPASPAVAAFAASREGRRRVGFHAWLQWHLDRQLAWATRPVPVVCDLAIGVDAGGADAWQYQEVTATGMRVGAPPDEFNTVGQDWGLPPWDPWKMRADGYRPFIETLRGGLRHAGGLRVDHVMGLFRLFWIPAGRRPDAGTYVRYPYWDLLNILALEAQRAGAYVVGEDLGTVEDDVRAELSERHVLSYKLLWFEAEPPPAWPEQALGAVSTHDLPTVPGLWSGADLRAQQEIGLPANEAGAAAMRHRLAEWTASADDAPLDAVVEGAYRTLADAPCRLLTASLDDVAGVEERPNMPGTLDEWPNWSLALPRPLEDLLAEPLPARVAAHLEAGGARPT